MFDDGLVLYLTKNCILSVLQGRVMREVGVEVVGLGALKLTGYLKELMQQSNISFESLYTVRAVKEVCPLNFRGHKGNCCSKRSANNACYYLFNGGSLCTPIGIY